jgi:hypothetical protein
MAYPIIAWQNILEDSDFATSSSQAGFTALNTIDWRPYTYWKGELDSPWWIESSTAYTRTANCIVIYSHNFREVRIPVLWLQRSDDGTTWIDVWSRALDPLPNNRIIIAKFAEASARWWRLYFDTAYVTPVVAPYIGIWWLGQSLDFPEGIPWGSNPIAQKIVSNAQRSQTGQLLGAVRNYLQLRFDLRISYLPDDWIRDNFEPFWQQAGSLLRPFFFAWDYENFEKDAFLASVPEDAVLDTPYTAPNKRDLALTLVGVAEAD